jgi:hypothetical protein
MRISGVLAGELHANAQITRLATNGVIAFNRIHAKFSRISHHSAIKNDSSAILCARTIWTG